MMSAALSIPFWIAAVLELELGPGEDCEDFGRGGTYGS